MCFAPQQCKLFRHLNLQKWSQRSAFSIWLRNMLPGTTACTLSTSQRPKVLRTCCVCPCWLRNVLRATKTCTFWTSQLPKVLRARCAFHILTSKCASGHNRVRTLLIFQHLNFQKRWEHEMCLEFLTSKSASHHDGVHFSFSHLTRWLRTRRFGQPTFRSSGATKHWKDTVFRNFSTFSRTLILYF